MLLLAVWKVGELVLWHIAAEEARVYKQLCLSGSETEDEDRSHVWVTNMNQSIQIGGQYFARKSQLSEHS